MEFREENSDERFIEDAKYRKLCVTLLHNIWNSAVNSSGERSGVTVMVVVSVRQTGNVADYMSYEAREGRLYRGEHSVEELF